MAYFGIDCSGFPGLTEMQWIKNNTNVSICGFYLGPAPSHSDAGWMPYRSQLANMGYGFLPIYVGQQVIGPGSHIVTKAEGLIDGPAACDLMRKAGFSGGSCIYLDLEEGPKLSTVRTDYLEGWISSVTANGYLPCVYCSHGLVEEICAVVNPVEIWAFRIPTTSVTTETATRLTAPAATAALGNGIAGPSVWQFRQNVQWHPPGLVKSLLVDMSLSDRPDPSLPTTPAPAIVVSPKPTVSSPAVLIPTDPNLQFSTFENWLEDL